MAAPIEQLIDDFLDSVRARGLSPKTIREYRFPLDGVLVPYCRQHGITEPEQLTRRRPRPADCPAPRGGRQVRPAAQPPHDRELPPLDQRVPVLGAVGGRGG